MVVAGWKGLSAAKEQRIPRYRNGFLDQMGSSRPQRLVAGTNFYDGPLQFSSLSRASAACLLYKPLGKSQDGWSTEEGGVTAGW